MNSRTRLGVHPDGPRLLRFFVLRCCCDDYRATSFSSSAKIFVVVSFKSRRRRRNLSPRSSLALLPASFASPVVGGHHRLLHLLFQPLFRSTMQNISLSSPSSSRSLSVCAHFVFTKRVRGRALSRGRRDHRGERGERGFAKRLRCCPAFAGVGRRERRNGEEEEEEEETAAICDDDLKKRGKRRERETFL